MSKQTYGVIAVFTMFFAMAIAMPVRSDEWIQHDNPDGRFSVLLPGKPELFIAKNHYESGLKIVQLRAPPRIYHVHYGDYATTRFDLRHQLNVERQAVVNNFLKAVPLSQKTTLMKIGNQERLTIEFTAEEPESGATYSWRIFFKGTRFYSFGVGTRKGYDSASQTQTFFESFALMDD